MRRARWTRAVPPRRLATDAMRRPPLIIRLSSRYRRRAVAARRMAQAGYRPEEIARILQFSKARLADALAGRAENGRLWTERETAVLRRLSEAAA